LFDYQIASLGDWPQLFRHVLVVRTLSYHMTASPATHDRSTLSALQVKAYSRHAQAIHELTSCFTSLTKFDERQKLAFAHGVFWLAISEVRICTFVFGLWVCAKFDTALRFASAKLAAAFRVSYEVHR
jgi:hypothetical protein